MQVQRSDSVALRAKQQSRNDSFGHLASSPYVSAVDSYVALILLTERDINQGSRSTNRDRLSQTRRAPNGRRDEARVEAAGTFRACSIVPCR